MGEVDVEGERPAHASTRAVAPPAARPALRPPPRPAAPVVKAEAKEAPAAAKPLAPPAPVAMGAVKRKVIVKRK
jgi:hypothetical protein